MIQVDPEQFLGLTKKRAQDLAEAKNLIFRLIRVDDEPFFSYPQKGEEVLERVCVEIEKGQVVKAVLS